MPLTSSDFRPVKISVQGADALGNRGIRRRPRPNYNRPYYDHGLGSNPPMADVKRKRKKKRVSRRRVGDRQKPQIGSRRNPRVFWKIENPPSVSF